MSDNSGTSAPVFLKRFFASPNRLRVGSKPELAHWVDRLARPEPLPSVLPCWRPDGALDWYGLAIDERQLRALGESLTAFVGPSYTTFRGRIAELDASDPIDASVAEFTSGRAYRFRGEDAKGIWAALERMRRGWERMGPRERAAPTPVGRVLRDFHMAIRAGLEAEAESTLLLLRDEYHLDGLNALYLRLELLASFGQWERLLGLPELSDLLQLRRPTAVTQAILRAVYHRFLIRFEDPLDPQGAVEAFSREVAPQFLPLLASKAGMRSAEVAKLFMLRAVALSPPELPLRDELLSLAELNENDRDYLKQIAKLAEDTAAPTARGNVLACAVEAAERSDFDRAFLLAKEAPHSVSKARLLCECAFELGTLEAKGEAIAAVRALGESDRETFLGRRVNQRLLESLKAPEDETALEPRDIEPVPLDWCSWLEHLDRHEGRKGSREIARRGASEWSIAEFLAIDGVVSRFTEQLQGTRTQEAERVLRDSLPHLLGFFQRDLNWPNPELRDVYRSLLDILIFSTAGGLSDLTVLNDLLEALLSLGTGDATSYRGLVEYVSQLWSTYASPVTLDWALDALELFAAYPRPAPESLADLFQSVVGRCQGFWRRIEPDQQELLRPPNFTPLKGRFSAEIVSQNRVKFHGLRIFGREFGQSAIVETASATVVETAQTPDDPFADLAGRSLAVYTLNESAARQVKQVLEARVPTARVALCHDTEGSSRLRQLARQSDLFVMAVSSATHAATGFITANRPPHLPLLRPPGKGSASVLRVLRDYLSKR
jgi:hypothetical protein